jgi:hypothetical protein
MRRIEGEQVLMRIFIGESDQWQHRPLYAALLELFRSKGLAGATVLKGVTRRSTWGRSFPISIDGCAAASSRWRRCAWSATKGPTADRSADGPRRRGARLDACVGSRDRQLFE